MGSGLYESAFFRTNKPVFHQKRWKRMFHINHGILSETLTNVLKYFRKRQAFLEGQFGITSPRIWKSTHLVQCTRVFNWSLKTREQKAREHGIPPKPATSFQWASKEHFLSLHMDSSRKWEELESELWTHKSIPSVDLVGFPHLMNCHQTRSDPRASAGCHSFMGYKSNDYWFFNQEDFRWLLQ